MAGYAETPAVPDFSDGFVKLTALGMPALDSGAKWSGVPGSGFHNYQLSELAKSLKGNSWLLTSADGNFRVLPMGGLEVIESERGSGGNLRRTSDSEPDEDVEKLVSAIKKAAGKNHRDEFSYGSRNSEIGALLLFAAQLHQTGRPALANRLALAVFELFPTREAALNAAVDLIADHLYQKAAGDFFKSGDWAVYHRALVDLVDRFPRGWMSRDAVRMLLPQLEKQVAGIKAPAPSLPGMSLDPRALELARELAEKQPSAPDQTDSGNGDIPLEIRYRMQMMKGMGAYYGGSSMPSSLWLIQDAPSEEGQDSTLVRLTGLKMAALPVLAALASDPFLTHIPNPRSSSGYYSSDETEAERMLRIHGSLNRPATRGEIAKQLLAATLPDPENELDEADTETIRDLAVTFWKEHQNASRVELAAVFLHDGSHSRSAQAATVLASSKDPEAYRIFEKHILASEEAIGSFQLVQTYLRTRRAAAKPFFDAYAKLVRSQTSETPDDDQDYNESSWAIKQAGGVDKILKQLEALVGTQSPRSFAVQIAKGPPEEAEASIKSLTLMLADASPTKHLFALLEGAAAASDATVRARFIDATIRIRRPGPKGDGDVDPSDREVSAPEAKVWRKLIADTREVPGQLNRFQRAEKSTVADLASQAFEYSVSPMAYSKVAEAAPVLSKPFVTLIREQAAARLAGEPLPPLPDASRVSPERLAEIVADAGEKTSADIHPYLKTLTPDERAAWLAWIHEPGELAMPENVKKLRFLVIGRHEEDIPGFTDTKGAGDIDTGFVLSAANLRAHVELLARDISKHSRTAIFLQSADFGPGLEVLAVSVPLPTKETDNDADNPSEGRSMRPSAQQVFDSSLRVFGEGASPEGVITVGLYGEHSYENAAWMVEKGKPDPVDSDNLSSLDSALENLAATPRTPVLRLGIQILSKADAEKIRESDSNDGDPFSVD